MLRINLLPDDLKASNAAADEKRLARIARQKAYDAKRYVPVLDSERKRADLSGLTKEQKRQRANAKAVARYHSDGDKSRDDNLKRWARRKDKPEVRSAARKRTADYRERNPNALQNWLALHPGYATQWQNANIEALRLRRRKSQGIQDAHRFDEVFAAQGGVCAVHGDAAFGKLGPCADHDHATNLLRGVLCSLCNAGIGMLGDTADDTRAAHAYLASAEDPYAW